MTAKKTGFGAIGMAIMMSTSVIVGKAAAQAGGGSPSAEEAFAQASADVSKEVSQQKKDAEACQPTSGATREMFLERLALVLKSHIDVSNALGKDNVCLSSDAGPGTERNYPVYSITLSEGGAALWIHGPLLYETCHGRMRYLPEIKGSVDFQLSQEELRNAGVTVAPDEEGRHVKIIRMEKFYGGVGEAATKKSSDEAIRRAMARAFDLNLHSPPEKQEDEVCWRHQEQARRAESERSTVYSPPAPSISPAEPTPKAETPYDPYRNNGPIFKNNGDPPSYRNGNTVQDPNMGTGIVSGNMIIYPNKTCQLIGNMQQCN